MSTIALKLASPLQSWGTSSNFDTRHTDYHPSKSAIIGLIAASMGYKRDMDYDIQKLNSLDYAVRVDKEGSLLMDYHTARKYKDSGDLDKKNTFVTTRYYLEDAVFVAAIGHIDNSVVEEIEFALKNPYFQPYLGRRSCPPTADFILGTFEEGVISVLSKIPMQSKYKNDETREKKLTIYADSNLVDNKTHFFRKDYVVSFSQKERKFRYRNESKLLIDFPSDEHDAMNF